MSRDWQADLWPTSFKGVPFWVRKADDEFGKRLQEDEFPEQDVPFVQELGASLERDQVDAYLAGDTSDVDGDAFKATLLSLGTGTFVHPTEGPIQVMFKSGRRAYELDRQGYIAFSLSFTRVAPLSSAPSADYLAQMAMDAAAGMIGGVTALLGSLVLS